MGLLNMDLLNMEEIMAIANMSHKDRYAYLEQLYKEDYTMWVVVMRELNKLNMERKNDN